MHDAARGIVDGGQHLVNGRFVVVGIEQNDIGESAAHVHTNQFHRLSLPILLGCERAAGYKAAELFCAMMRR